MVNHRISIRKVGFLVFILTSLILPSQAEENKFQLILKCLFDSNAETVNFNSFSKQSIFLFKTDKCCIPCYRDMQEIYKKEFPDYQVNIVIIMPEELLQIHAQTRMIQQYYKQPDGFYFLFLEDGKLICEESTDVDLELLNDMNSSPSPYYLIKNNEQYTFIDSDSTIYQMENR